MAHDPLAACARARGATFADVGGVPVIAGFGDAAAEYAALRADAALVDLPGIARLRVTGSDRITFLQGMLSNDVRALEPGRGCSALLLNDHGKVVADLVVLAGPDVVLLDGAALGVVSAVPALERYIVADDVELALAGPDDHVLAVLGPRAEAVLAGLGVDDPPGDDWAHVEREAGGVRVHVVRMPALGAGGYAVHLPEDAAATWWTRAVDGGLRPAGMDALEVLRVESGVPAYGIDVTADTLALEAPLEASISFKKGCYLGQEVVERVSARGHVNRRLVGLACTGAVVPAAADIVRAGDRDVGWITSAVWSWRLGHPIALGYVRREHLTPATPLTVVHAGTALAATVSPLPFAMP